MVASLKSCGGIQGLSCDIVRTARPLRTLRQSQCGLKQRSLNLMQIGELAKTSLSDAAKTAIPNIPWKQLYGVRNRIVHGYDGVDMRIVWDTVSEDIPQLHQSLKAIIENSGW